MRHGNSGQGSILIGRKEALSAYDALPPSLRRLLGRGPYNWSSIEVLKLYRQEGKQAVIDRIRSLSSAREQKYYEAAENGFRGFNC